MNNKKKLHKKCKICGLESSDLSLYVHSHNKLKSGERSLTIKNICYKCKWIGIREKVKDSLKSKISYIRECKDVPCTDCGKRYPFYVMDFDHINDKSFTIAESLNRNLENIKKEISKCEVVCSNCHRIRTYNRKLNQDKTKKGSE